MEQPSVGYDAHQAHAAHDLGHAVVVEHHAALHAAEYIGVPGAAQADAEYRMPQEIIHRPGQKLEPVGVAVLDVLAHTAMEHPLQHHGARRQNSDPGGHGQGRQAPAADDGKPPVQVIGPLLCQVGAEQNIQHQHPHPQAQGIVQGQRLHGLLPGDHVAAAQQGGDGHQGQAHAAAAQAKRHRPHGKVPQKRQHQRRHQGRAGQEVRQLPVALGGHEKRHEKRAHRSQQIRAGGQQPDDDAAQGHHTIDRLPRSHKRPRHRQQYGKICAAQPEPLCIPAKPGKKCKSGAPGPTGPPPDQETAST